MFQSYLAGFVLWLRGVGFEGLLDLLLPLSLLTFLAEPGRDPLSMIALLSFWLAVKLLSSAQGNSLYLVLLGVLLVCVSTLIGQASVSSSPTDLIVFLLAFAAGLGRARRHWRVSLWALALVGVVAMVLFRWKHGVNDNLAVLVEWLPRSSLLEGVGRIAEIAINRSAYILGLVFLSCWSLFRYGSRGFLRVVAAALLFLAYALAVLTGSRAGAGLPILVLVLIEFFWRLRFCIQARVVPITIAILSSSALFCALIYLPGSPLAYRNLSDAGRAEVAHCFLSKSVQSPSTFLFGHGGDVVNLACKNETRNPHIIPSGLTHAHNVFLQILADNGLICLAGLVALLFVALRNGLAMLVAGDAVQGSIAVGSALFFIGFGLIESTLIHVLLQQVLAGYLLSASWPSERAYRGVRRASPAA